MFSIKRSAAALAITAGLFAAAAPASHGATQPRSSATITKTDRAVSSFSWNFSEAGSPVKASTVLEDSMISGSVTAKAAKNSSTIVAAQGAHASKKGKRGKGKGKPTHTYDLASPLHA